MPSKIKLFDNIYATKYKALVIGDTGIIGDLHLGYEQDLTSQGVFIPKTQFKEMKNELQKFINEYKIKTLIINGDLKHDFSDATKQEWGETEELIEFLKKSLDKIIIVKGNHDNYLKTIVARKNILFYDDFYSFDDIIIAHGNKDLVQLHGAKTVIFSHIHPSIFLKDDVGVGVKIPCFLYKKGKPNLVVIPAFSPLFEGIDVLSTPEKELPSRFIRKYLGDFKVIGVDKDLYKFPEIRKIRKNYHL